MQRVARNSNGSSQTPHGYVPIFEIEAVFLAAVENWAGLVSLEKCNHWHHLPSCFIDPEFFGLPEKQWRERADEHVSGSLQLRSVASRDRRALARGIADFMLAKFLNGNRDRLSVLLEGEVPPKNLPDTVVSHLFGRGWEGVGESEVGPATFTQLYARQMLLERAGGHRANFPFIDVENWSVRCATSFPTPSNADEALTFEVAAEMLAPFSGAFISVRSKIPDKTAIHEEIDRLSGLISPLTDERVETLVVEAKRFYEERSTFTRFKAEPFKRDLLASHLGSVSNRRSFGRVWRAFLRTLPEEESSFLSGHGRKKARTDP